MILTPFRLEEVVEFRFLFYTGGFLVHESPSDWVGRPRDAPVFWFVTPNVLF
jgi:hypothetical protein